MRSKGYILIGLVCVFYWIIDSIWSYLSFEYNLKYLIFSQPGSYLDTFFLDVAPYQAVSRLMVVALFAVLGSIVVEFFIRRQRAEKRLQETHDTLLTVLNSIDATIYASDMKTNRILFMNRFMIDSFGGDFTGEICYEVFRKEKEMCGDCPVDKLLDKSGAPKGVVVWEGRNSITGAWYVNCDRAVGWIDGRLVHLQIATDISQMKNLREKQEKAEAQLRQARKMESLGNLAGGIAHDFNNILSSIIGYTELVLDDVEKGSLIEENLREVFAAGNRAKELVRRILAFARQSDEELKPVKVASVAKEVLKFIRSSIPATIVIEQKIESDSLILGAASQIHRILMNLCTNAAQAMDDEGGVLTVFLKDVAFDDSEELKHSKLENGDYIELKVSDTGPGIADEIADSIFEPYFTTKAPGEGTGMGLAMVHGTVESYKGKVFAESREGKGATFTIYLPILKKHAENVSREPEESPGGFESILFIDDEAAIAKMGRQLLERLGYNVTVRTCGMEALQLFRKKSDDFDLIVSDMTMPGMTGDALAVEAMAVRPDIPVILCTGYSKKISDEKAERIGVKALLHKPLIKAELARIVRKTLDDSGGE